MKKISFLIVSFLILFSFSLSYARNIEVRRQGEGNSATNSGPILTPGDRDPLDPENNEGPRIITPRNEIRAGERAFNYEEVRAQRMIEVKNRVMEMTQIAKQIRESRREEIEKKQLEFKEKIGEIKDNQIKVRTENLSNNINNLNENLSQRYSGMIGAIEIVLDKVESRANKIEAETGKDLSSVYSKIEEGRNAIEISREEIAQQKSKIYLPDINIIQNSPEIVMEQYEEWQPVQTSLKNLKEGLREDHNALRIRTIESLKLIIKETIEELKSIIIIDPIEEPLL